MHTPLARLSRAGLAAFVAACLTATFAPSTVFASRWVVDQNGGGDFATIQEAVNSWENGLGWRDSVLVMPGTYPETMTSNAWPYFIVGVGGSEATMVNSIGFIGYSSSHPYRVEGIAFVEHVDVSHCPQDVQFKRCVFGTSVSGVNSRPPGFEDCDFYGRTALLGLGNSGHALFSASRFHSAPVQISVSDGDVWLENCTFEGPADTLLFVEWADSDDPLYLRACRFENARHGVVSESPFGINVVSSTFRHLSEAGVWLEPELLWTDGFWSGSRIERSRFEGCQTAIHWRPAPAPGLYENGLYLSLDRDTVLACTGDGLVIGPITNLDIHNCVVDGSGGKGGVVHLDYPAYYYPYSFGTALVRSSVFTNNLLGGLVLEDISAFTPGPYFVDSCTFAQNGGPGLQANCSAWSIEHCMSFANGGDGFAFATPAPGYPTRLVANTSVFNQGDGVGLTGPVHPGDSLHVVQHNLSAMNAGVGFRVPHQSFGSFAFNDAWTNYLGQYAGAWGSADSNLTADPRFCDLGAGDLGLQQGSPCGAAGLYGLIGALPEQCPNTTAVEPTTPRLSFAVRPTVARGSVEFVPPTSGTEGRIELFDLSGRRLWGAAFGPTTRTLRWQGQSDAGHAQPGLYWVRFTRAGEVQSQRLVWLR